MYRTVTKDLQCIELLPKIYNVSNCNQRYTMYRTVTKDLQCIELLPKIYNVHVKKMIKILLKIDDIQ